MRKICVFSMIVICLWTQVFAASDDELFDRGVGLLKQEKSREAVEVFTQLIKLVPDSPDAFRNRGVGYMKLGRYDEAIGDFEKAMALKPDLKDLYSNLGVAWYYKKNYQKAIEYYDKELALRPDNHFGYFNRAICRAALNEFEPGLKDVEKSLALFPNHYLALCLKGDLLVKTGNPRAARKIYERALTLDSDHAYAKKQLAKLDLKNSGPVKQETAKPPGPGTTVKTPALRVKEKKDSPVQGFEIQTGAFLGKENAEKMVEKIRKKGHPARVLALTGSKGRQWFLVRTGSFKTRADAGAARVKIKADLGGDAVIRPEGRF